jgi:hypothetical protein
LLSQSSLLIQASEGWLEGRESHESFRIRSPSFDPMPSLSDSGGSPTAVFSSAFFRLPTLADFTGVMSLAASVFSDPFVEARVEILC